MADLADQANDLIEAHLNNNLSRINLKKPTYTGVCMFCGDKCGERRFCDSHCRQDYESSKRKR